MPSHLIIGLDGTNGKVTGDLNNSKGWNVVGNNLQLTERHKNCIKGISPDLIDTIQKIIP